MSGYCQHKAKSKTREINRSTKAVKIYVENVRLPLRVLLSTIGSEKEGKCGKIEI